jgi:hypothetical protein
MIARAPVTSPLSRRRMNSLAALTCCVTGRCAAGLFAEIALGPIVAMTVIAAAARNIHLGAWLKKPGVGLPFV